MNSIDDSAGDRTRAHIATTFFYDVVVPLKRAGAQRGESFFATAFDADVESYWQKVSTRTGGVAQLSNDELDGASLLDLLTAHWETSGQQRLVRVARQVRSLERNLAVDPCRQQRRPDDSNDPEELSDVVYPLF